MFLQNNSGLQGLIIYYMDWTGVADHQIMMLKNKQINNYANTCGFVYPATT